VSGHRATGWAWRAVRVAAIAIIVLALVGPVLLALMGHRVLVVDGGSMSPTFERGDVVVTSRPTGADLTVGRPVLIGTGASTYLHRVVERVDDRAKLQGDANPAPDPGWVTQADVTGIVSVHLGPPWSSSVGLLTTWPARIALVGLLVVLVWSGRRVSRTG